jgi:hypothetical protein
MPIGTGQMTDHTLEGVKGWPNPHAIDCEAKISAATITAVTDPSAGRLVSGRCVSLNGSDEFQLGLFANTSMPMFIFPNSDDPDVSLAYGAPATAAGGWVPIAPTGVAMALVAAGAYELATTAFDATKDYVAGEVLGTTTTGIAGANQGTATTGDLTNYGIDSGGAFTQSLVGVVAKGRTPTSATNSHGQAELAFWPVYLPIAV